MATRFQSTLHERARFTESPYPQALRRPAPLGSSRSGSFQTQEGAHGPRDGSDSASVPPKLTGKSCIAESPPPLKTGAPNKTCCPELLEGGEEVGATATVTLSPGHPHAAPWEQRARCPKRGRRLMTKPKASPLSWLPRPTLINGARSSERAELN